MTLVLLHPLPLDGSIWPDAVRSLAEDVVAPDLCSLGDHVEVWADAVLQLAGDGPLVVVGSSVGGSCAIEIALRAPDRVAAIVLSGTKAGHDPDPQLRDEALEVLAGDGVEVAWRRYWRPLFGPRASARTVDRALAVAVSQGPDAVARGVRAFHGRPDRDDFLDSWSGPVWIVNGEHDRPERARLDARRLADCRFVEVPGAGHYLPLEAPDEFAGVIAEALGATARQSKSARSRTA